MQTAEASTSLAITAAHVPVIAASSVYVGVVPVFGAIALGVLAIVELFKKLFKGPSPYDEIDSGHVEQGMNSCAQIWFLISGEALYGVVDPNDPTTSAIVRDYTKEKPPLPFKQYATWSSYPPPSKYPNVPKGPLGDMSVDIDQAIQGCSDIVNQVLASLGGQPGVPYSNGDPATHLKQSLSNPFFTDPGGEIIALLQKVKAARDAAALVSNSTGASASALVSEISSNPVAVIAGLGLLGVALWSFA